MKENMIRATKVVEELTPLMNDVEGSIMEEYEKKGVNIAIYGGDDITIRIDHKSIDDIYSENDVLTLNDYGVYAISEEVYNTLLERVKE